MKKELYDLIKYRIARAREALEFWGRWFFNSLRVLPTILHLQRHIRHRRSNIKEQSIRTKY